MKQLKSKIVLVEWDDASYNSGFYDAKDPKAFDPVATQTVGHLIKRNKKQITLGMERFDFEEKVDLRHIVTIPQKMVRRVRRLE